MDVFSTELRIRLSFVKTSEFRVVEPPNPTRYATATQHPIIKFKINLTVTWYRSSVFVTLRSVDRYFAEDISGHPIGPIRGQAVQEVTLNIERTGFPQTS
jgi:hypothetical protein